MDGYRDEFRGMDDGGYSPPVDAAYGAASVSGPADDDAIEAPPQIGDDERRMHVRAYNYWVSILKGRPYPSIEDLEPQDIGDFGPHSVLLDFTSGSENPAVAFIGADLRAMCGLDADIQTIADVPPRSLLSRLTDHYMQIIANCAPVGFEAEFVGDSGRNTLYRGILMPLSSDGDTIDFIYGVINWKEVADEDVAGAIAGQVAANLDAAPPAPANDAAIWADGPHAESHGFEPAALDPESADADDAAEDQFDLSLDPDAGLADRLMLARECADAAKNADARSRGALYRALGLSYDFALLTEARPDEYAELLEDAEIKAQARAPMTPVVKLVFGAQYDKARLTEFAAALSHGRRVGIGLGELSGWMENYAGGLKGIVGAERAARRPEPRPSQDEAAAERLRNVPAMAHVDLDVAGEGEFVLLVARREADGRLALVAPVADDKALLSRALRKAAS